LSDVPAPRAFFEEQLPAQFEAALREQERAVEAASRVLEGMRAVHATIRAEVRGEGGGTFFLNVAGGRVTPGDRASQPPFLTLVLEQAGFAAFVRSMGGSALGFLGALSGLAQEMRLTQARIDGLAGMQGTLRFELRGAGGFTLLTHFGAGEPTPEPATSIAVDQGAFEALRAGRLNPQDAFLGGQIQVEGDLQLAMQLALATVAPD
jgi:SCP-2 sterol transfer family